MLDILVFITLIASILALAFYTSVSITLLQNGLDATRDYVQTRSAKKFVCELIKKGKYIPMKFVDEDEIKEVACDKLLDMIKNNLKSLFKTMLSSWIAWIIVTPFSLIWLYGLSFSASIIREDFYRGGIFWKWIIWYAIIYVIGVLITLIRNWGEENGKS